MTQVISRVNQFCASFDSSPRCLWIAYSGGMDSHVLLHALANQRQQYPHLTIAAIHVNHQLQSESDFWQLHCQQQCEMLDIPLTSVRVDAHPETRQSPEEAAREARYLALQQNVTTNDVLVTAHHCRDQAETFLLQLMRGAGLAGLSGMPEYRLTSEMSLYRPLLDVSYQEILDYATLHDLDWVEDPSNQDTAIRRNFVRHELIPAFKQMWPNAIELIAKSSAHLSADKLAIDWFISRELQQVCSAPDVMDINRLQRYPRSIQSQLIRGWYTQLGLHSPGSDKLSVIFDEIIASRRDAQPQLCWQGSVLHRSRSLLIITPLWQAMEAEMPLGDTQLQTSAWRLFLHLQDSIDHNQLEIRQIDAEMTVPVNGMQKRVKRLFKEVALPVLLRGHMPAVYHRDELILIPGIYQNNDYLSSFDFDFNRFTTSGKEASRPLLSVLGID